MKVILLIIIIAVAQSSAAEGSKDQTLSKAWKFDTTSWNFDPTAWDGTFKERMIRVGSGALYAAYMGMNVPWVLAFAVFLFGLVKLNWLLVVTSCIALHGWRHNHRVLLALGLGVTYALSFGFSL